MTKLTLNTQKKLTASAMIVGLASVAGSAAAAPTLFDASATVQSAVAITNPTPLTFGTVFATTSAVVSTAATVKADAAPLSNKITMTPAGVLSGGNSVAAATAAPILVLSGSAPGVVTIPTLPAGAKIKILLSNIDGVATINATDATNSSCGYATPALARAAGKVVLQLSAGDPNATGFFCLDAFTAAVGATALSAGTLLPTSTAFGAAATDNTTGYTLPFGVTALTFNLGATLVQQVPTTGATRTYETGSYTGKIGMEVNYL
jgi:hypothetical protein